MADCRGEIRVTEWLTFGRIAAKRIRPHDIEFEFESVEREISLTPRGLG